MKSKICAFLFLFRGELDPPALSGPRKGEGEERVARKLVKGHAGEEEEEEETRRDTPFIYSRTDDSSRGAVHAHRSLARGQNGTRFGAD